MKEKTERRDSLPFVVRKRRDQVWDVFEDRVVEEKPVKIFVNNEEMGRVVCSPWSLEEMAAGYLCAEGVLDSFADLEELTITEDGSAAYAKVPGFPGGAAGRKAMQETIEKKLSKVNESPLTISVETVFHLADQLENGSDLFKNTGGVHGAALAQNGEILQFMVDIGRHNALDKLTGWCCLNRIPMEDKAVVFSGRVPSEIIYKVAKMECPLIIARSAPTSLALELADKLGITVIAFARDRIFNLYTHPERILDAPK
ncbi:MAG: formate dehydrogenase accessory sulfurtransferase FdhD [Clostridiales bacterium]|nr:formate dehydrogenase accessory sulfurtransferase FdhD [Clostridiales bacterium]